MNLPPLARLAVGVAGVAAATAFALVARRSHRELPVVGHLPAFELIDERGAPFSSAAMLGHVSVVDFIFTRCPSSCPRLTAQMGQLQERFAHDAPNVRLVSFSVDPENDTPAVLAEYAVKAGARPSRWIFVTGPVDEVARAVVLGFKVSAAKVATGAGDYDVTHGEWLVLVDRAGYLRGYYPTAEPKELDALADDVLRLDRDVH